MKKFKASEFLSLPAKKSGTGMVFFLLISAFMLASCSGFSKKEALLTINKNNVGEFTDYSGQTVISNLTCLGDGPSPWATYFHNSYVPGSYYWYNKDGIRVDEHQTVSGGKWGLVRKAEFGDEFQMITEPVYDWCGYFSSNRAAVSVNGKWGFIDTTGEMVISPRYDDRGENVLLWKRKNPVSGLYGNQFNYLDWFYSFHDGQAWIFKNGLCGIISADGRTILEPQFDINIYRYNDSLTWFKEKDKYGIIDRNGVVRLKPFADSIGPFKLFRNDRLWVRYDKKWALLDLKGHMIIYPAFDEVSIYNAHAWVNIANKIADSDERHIRWGLVDSTDHLLIDPATDSVRFGGHIRPVRQNGKWGYLVRGMFRDEPPGNYLSGETEEKMSDIQNDDAINKLHVLLPGGISIINGDAGNGLTGIGKAVLVSGTANLADIQDVFNQQSIAFNSCYVKQCKQKPNLSGLLVLDVHINTSGKVGEMTNVNNSIDQEVGRCVMKKIMGLRFPKPQKIVVIRVPMAFTKY